VRVPPPGVVTAPEDVVVNIRPNTRNIELKNSRKKQQKTERRRNKKKLEKQRESADFYLITFSEKEIYITGVRMKKKITKEGKVKNRNYLGSEQSRNNENRQESLKATQ
jgi:hypothetical protein